MSVARIAYEACPLCGDAAIIDLAEVDCRAHPAWQPELPAVIEWCQCHACGHVFTGGYFGADGLAAIFRTTLEHQRPGFDVEGQRLAWSRVVERVTATLPAVAGAWLDVGFGNGSLLFTAQEWGYETHGIDQRADAVAQLKGFGVNAELATLADLSGEKRFRVISLADVLEHMPYPNEALAAAARLIEDDGRLFISSPNRETAVWKALDQMGANPYWGELEHFHNFSRAGMIGLLEKRGFVLVHYTVSDRYRSGMDIVARKR